MSLNRQVKKKIRKTYDGHCAYCGTPHSAMTVDHVHPKKKQGVDNASNCLPACTVCNSAKRDYSVKEFKRLLNMPWLWDQIWRSEKQRSKLKKRYYKKFKFFYYEKKHD